MKDGQERDIRLDLTKAIAISLVLIWHLQPIQVTLTEGSGLFVKLLKYGMEQFYYQVSLVAVPLFFLVSIFLYFEKTRDNVFEYTKKRFIRVAKVFLFWTIIQTLVFLVTRSIEEIQIGKSVLQFPSVVWDIIVGGDIPLPHTGESILYFLFVLLGLILLAAIFSVFKEKQFLIYVSILLILISVIYFEYKNIYFSKIPYWRIDNFLIYVPIAYLLWRDKRGISVYFIPLLFLGFTLFSTYDLFLRRIEYQSGIYARLSIVLGASALFMSFLQFRNLKKNWIVSFLSKYSLGIFVIHLYWLKMIQNMLLQSDFYTNGSVPVQPLNIWGLIISVAVIGLTVISILILRKTPLKSYIS